MIELKKYLSGIKKILRENSVIFAYLFGSQLHGITGKLSDVDIAVFMDKNLSDRERFDKKLRIMSEVSTLLKKDEIDIVILNDAYPLLEHRIIKHGNLIFSEDEKERIQYEVRATMRYLDFKPFIEKYTEETLYGG